MNPTAPRSAGLSRRAVLALGPAAVGLWMARGVAWPDPSVRVRRDEDPVPASGFERAHFPAVQTPIVAANGAKVPIVIGMTHPMDPDHHVRMVEVVNPSDPVPSKGLFRFTPASGRIHLGFQARMHDGPSEVLVTAECNRHGRWTTTRSIQIADGAGGCAAPAASGSASRPRDPEILPPRLRIPKLVAGETIRPDEIIEVQVLIRHPNRTGLAWRDGRFVQESEPFHLEELAVLYGAAEIARFRLTSALSDDPLIAFRVRTGRGGPLRVRLRNTRGERFEALAEVSVS